MEQQHNWRRFFEDALRQKLWDTTRGIRRLRLREARDRGNLQEQVTTQLLTVSQLLITYHCSCVATTTYIAA